jgi:hypothetical protein
MPTLSAREFVSALAQLISTAGPLTRTIGGTIGWMIHGTAGGAWTVDLDVDGGTWTRHEGVTTPERDPIAEADVRVYGFERAFSSLILSPETVEAMADEGLITVEGDRSKLTRLAQLLRQGGSLLEQRARPANSTQQPGRARRTRPSFQ